MKKFKMFLSIAMVAVFMSGSLLVQAQVERICDDNGEKRVRARLDDKGYSHCWEDSWDTMCYVPCDAEPETIAP